MPRRQCCTTVVGFKKRNTALPPPPPRPPSSSSQKSSALRRASVAVMSAFKKSLPLSQKSSVKVKVKLAAATTSFLSRSFTRKGLCSSSRRFWKKVVNKEEGIKERESGGRKWRRSFRELLMEERRQQTKTTMFNNDNNDKDNIMFIVNPITAVSNEDMNMVFNVDTSITTTSSGCGSESWGESEFTFSSSSDNSAEKDLVDEGNKEGETCEKNIEDGATQAGWPNEEKEQFSPVSILDCPFEDDEEITSHFNSTTDEVGQPQHKQKSRHFESVTSLEPVTLEKMFTLPELEDETYESKSSSFILCSSLEQIMCTKDVTSNVIHDHEAEEKVHDLLNLVKRSIISSNNSSIINEENLLLDYFNQSIEENNDNSLNHSTKLHLCEIAKDWICGQPKEVYLGWEVKDGRHVYIREMDTEWKNSDQETQEVAQELENEVLTSLVNELLFDLTMQQL